MNFKFNLSQPVTIACSGETGEVIGRAEYMSSEPTYQVRYKSADGRGVEAWWVESALSKVEQCERSDSEEPGASNINFDEILKRYAMHKTWYSFLRAVETGSVTNPPRLYAEMATITDQYLSKRQESKRQEGSLDK